MPRTLCTTGALFALALAAGCAAPPAADVGWSELEPVVGTARGTDIISRAAPDSLGLLGKGWSVDVDTVLTDGIWVVGIEAALDVVVVRDGDHQLVFEALPAEGIEQQIVALRLNGQPVGEAVTLQPGWSRYVVPLPARNLHPGHNRIRFAFREIARPSDRLPDSSDDRPLAARFRFLQLLPSGSDRALAEEADPDLVLTGGTEAPVTAPPIPAAPRTGNRWNFAALPVAEDDSEPRLVFEADSLVQVALTVPPESHLVGSAHVAAPEGGGTASWQAELVDADGTVHELGDGSNGSLRANLSAHAGSEALLRIRTIGSRGAAVVWEGLGLSDPTGSFDRQLLEVPALPVPRVTGELGRSDVVIIMLDAARPDFFSTYRGSTPTPAVDALAMDGTRFEHAYAAAPWTNQSTYSMLSGRYPEAHGVEGWRDLPPRDMRTLFQLTYAAGYHTVLWSEHPLYRASKGLRYDVDQYVDIKPRDRYEMREELSRPDIFVDDKPTFAVFHLIPPHDPYEYDGTEGPPPPWSNSMMRDFRTDFDLRAPNLQRYSWTVGDAPPTEDDLRYVMARYQDNLRYADELVRRIVEGLKRAGRYDDALIMLVSDHGEAFYEHGHFLHTWPLYEEVLRIPFVVKWPAGVTDFQRAVDRVVSNVDMAPTVVDAIGYQGDDPGHQGQSLLPLVFDGFFPTRDIYASTVGVSNGLGDDEPLKPMTSLIARPWKLIHDKVSGRVELYDLETDPGETDDLAAERPLLAQQLLQRLFLQERANLALNSGAEAADPDAELDPELRARLCALGYVDC